jgi:hypothetical protein
MFCKILEHPEHHKNFEVDNNLIYYLPNSKIRVLCILHSKFWGKRVTKLVLDQAHRIVGHMGPSITKNYAQQNFWWPTLGSDVKALHYVSSYKD